MVDTIYKHMMKKKITFFLRNRDFKIMTVVYKIMHGIQICNLENLL